MPFSESTPAEVVIEQPRGKIWIRPEFQAEVTPDSFRAASWGERATPVAVGGRGGAWFIEDGGISWVLREYRRGGFAAKLSRRSYWFSTEQRTRSLMEYRLLCRLYGQGLPVPKPVAASYRKTTPISYQAEIIIERIPDATTFADHLIRADAPLWYRVGALVRLFHDSNVYHADLNCHNILLAQDRLYLIDFDKGEIRAGSTARSDWKKENLARLYRSIAKLSGDNVAAQVDSGWQELRRGYGQAYSGTE